MFLLVDFSYAQTNEDEKLITFISKAPYFKGDIKRFIQEEIVYPTSAKRDSIEVIVHVSFWVDTLGHTYNHLITRSIRDDLDVEALRVVKLIKYDKPALQKRKPIMVKIVIPVEFYMRNSNITKCKVSNIKKSNLP